MFCATLVVLPSRSLRRQAVELAEKLAKEDVAYLYDFACHRALLSTLVDPKETERKAAAAVDTLHGAVAAGYDMVYPLKTDRRRSRRHGRRTRCHRQP